MATLTLEYDARNSTVRRLVEGLLSSGLFRVKSEQEKERIEIQKNMRTANKMIKDIRINGSSKYQNMDSFLSSLK
jgi:roadblock/LC7 domain-containing protein